MNNYLKYYHLENYLLNEVRENFHKKGFITAFEFFCIIIWKANRAKSKIAKRLMKNGANIEDSVHDLTGKISNSSEDQEKLKVLLDHGFLLPMSSAILSILYPDRFTIYDVRVCEAFPQFKKLYNKRSIEKIWPEYKNFIACVKASKPAILSLRDKDRYLWGKSFYEQLNDDIKRKFKK